MPTLDGFLAVIQKVVGGARAEPPAADAASAPASDPVAVIDGANQDVRQTARWVITSFAAIGAILLGGISLSTLGSLTGATPHERIYALVAGIALAVLGIAIAISTTSGVLAPQLNTFGTADKHRNVTDQVLGDRELVGLTYDELKRGVHQADEDLKKTRGQATSDDDPRVKEMLLVRADWEMSKRLALARIGQQLLWNRYVRARRVIIWVALPITAAGLGGFAWGANPPKTETQKPAVPLGQTPVLLDVSLSKLGVSALQPTRQCRTPSFQALSINTTTSGGELVTIPNGSCKTVRFILTPSVGVATAAERP
jgi:hypothetical protein